MRICEIIEKFPKLSGLSGINTKNLLVKNEKGDVPLCYDVYLKNLIKAKDVVIFELDFKEIWLEVEMNLNSEDKNLNILFELKVNVNYFISHLKDILVKMGIQSWAKYVLDIEDNSEDYNYYLFSGFYLNFSDKEGNLLLKEMELDNFNGNLYNVIILFFSIRKN